jgi:CheY-like chemotaxis protein
MTTTYRTPTGPGLYADLLAIRDALEADYLGYLQGKPWWTAPLDSAKYREGQSLAVQLHSVRLTLARAGAALAVLGDWRPDLIILDLLMPDFDQAAFRAEQARRGAADVPILALSAALNPEAVAEALAPAAVLHKPFDLGHLLETVLDLSRAAGG